GTIDRYTAQINQLFYIAFFHSISQLCSAPMIDLLEQMRILIAERSGNIGCQMIDNLHSLQGFPQFSGVQYITLYKCYLALGKLVLSNEKVAVFTAKIIINKQFTYFLPLGQKIGQLRTYVTGAACYQYFHSFFWIKSVCSPHSVLLSPNHRECRSSCAVENFWVQGSQPILR